MKHHFGDWLDRSGGHWKMVPNVARYKYRVGDWAAAKKTLKIATMEKGDRNWERAASLPNLRELTLHEPSAEQLAFAGTLTRLQRLRISHARPKTLDFIAPLRHLEEVVLEYVSGFDDLAPLGALPTLRAAHLENLRGVRDFSGLSGDANLQSLSIFGTLDWDQPIESFAFLTKLKKLEYFGLGFFRSLAKAPALLPLAKMKNLKKGLDPTA